ncbi:MAG: cytochrome c1 [Alphaproteobacteria bacterium]
MKRMQGLTSVLKTLTLSAAMAAGLGFGAQAAGDAKTPADHDWSFEGIFGTFERASAQRGLQVYLEVCAACHALEHLHYRNLADLGYSEAEIKAIAANWEVEDGPNEDGEMFTRPARPSDPFARPFPNDAAARAANNGALPVDLSVVVKARAHGADYIHALLTGYEEAPEGFDLLEGTYYNPYFEGRQIAMIPPLMEGLVEYGDGTEATVEQMSRDVTLFLAWAAEPELEERKALGIKVMLFLLVLAGLLYAVKRRIWADIH